MRTTYPLLAFLSIALLASACKKNQKATDAAASAPTATEEVKSGQLGGPTPSDSLVFVLQRTPCFGHCPAYRIEVFRSGYATYDGVVHVEKVGPYEGRVDPALLRDLIHRADSIGFDKMPDAYDADVTDLPSAVVRIVANGHDKQVKARVGTPQRLRAYIEHAEGLLLPLAWKPVPDKR